MTRLLGSAFSSTFGRGLLVALLMTVAWLIYWPGLAGAFLFDDYSNLSLLGLYGKVDDWQSLWLYLLSGFSGPTGRPVSHLSFLIDANHWPADPWPFKRTNLVIHLVSGLLLFGVLRSLVLGLGHSAREAFWVGGLATALWLLHPFWVSTTLYAVQRMAQLATLFVLAGLWSWVMLRRRLAPSASPTWVFLCGLVVVSWGALAVLSKENGALLPLLIVVLEATVLAAMDRRLGRAPTVGFRRLRWLLLGMPSVGLLGYLAARGLPPLLTGEGSGRSFTVFERLLTEGRILWEYLFQIWVPRPYPGGLFNDDIQVSTGLFSPWNTVVSWAGLLAVLILAVRFRQQFPVLAAAVLFFLAGHLLESTILPLELYFEHRNYLPAALMFLPVALWWVTRARVPEDLRVVIPLGVLAMLAIMTFMRADLWASPYLQALKWAEVNPDSPRAQHHLAGFWWEVGNLDEARRLNDLAIRLDPDGLPWLMTRVMYQCSLDDQPGKALSRVESVLESKGRIGSVVTYQTEKLLDYLMSGSCGRLSEPRELLALMERLDETTLAGPGRLGELVLQRRAVLLLRLGRTQAAYDNLRELVNISDRPGMQLRGAAMLASAGRYELALRLLDVPVAPQATQGRFSIERLRDWYLGRTGYYAGERAALRETIRDDLHARRKSEEHERLRALP